MGNELVEAWVDQRLRRVEVSELREVSHVDVLPAPTCSSTQVRAERAVAVERRWSGGGAVVTASARAPISAPLSRAHLELDGLGCVSATMAQAGILYFPLAHLRGSSTDGQKKRRQRWEPKKN